MKDAVSKPFGGIRVERVHSTFFLRRKTAATFVRYVILCALSVVFILPFFWTLSTALKHPSQILVHPIRWIPRPVMWSNFVEAWNAAPFTRYFLNTTYITFTATLGNILSCSLVAFGFARIDFPGRDKIFMVLLATMMVPDVVRRIPMYLLFRELGWLDTFKPLIVPSYFAGSAFYVFLLRQFYLTLPSQLEEAALIDGCSYFGIWWRIFLPLSKVGLATVGIFSFIEHWNEFFSPLVYLRSHDKFTLSMGLRFFIDDYVTQYHYLMAVSFVALLPCLAIFFFTQRYFIEGIALTGIKE